MSEQRDREIDPNATGLMYVINALGLALRDTETRLLEVTQINADWQKEVLNLREQIEKLQNLPRNISQQDNERSA